ncbi:Vacuolar protein sorting-associated protein 20 [Entophlyctis luteolus]|nr:Vacuolar protein sorting-associated protein 20 [Entophlyctis luteolus]KAJ3380074.1 Vacuolar protein sorting-associated protein 20 [Entophlyctis sp. JEL0112]
MGNAPSKKPPAITAHDRAILDLKVQRDKLRKYQKKLALVVQNEADVAKAHLRNGDKRRALIALKKKKYQEGLIEQTDMQLLNLEQMTETIEFTLIERDIFEGLKKGNAVLNEIHKEMNIESVQKLMDDTADAIEYQNEIDQVLSGRLNESEMQDIEDELDALVAQELHSLAPANTALPIPNDIEEDLPSVPMTEPGEATRIKIRDGKEKARGRQREEQLAAS